jgi:hypothetical protein
VPPAEDVPLRARDLLATLLEHGVQFVVIGGFALAPHGFVRGTKDIDIVPDPAADNLARLAGALLDLQAAVDLGDIAADELGIVPDKEGLGHGGNWILHTRLGRLDILQEVAGLRDYAQLRAGAIEVSGVMYAGYDELISMKAAAGRPEDLRDIGALEAARRPR